MATLVDLRSEPAVEELSRQIMSEAKLWEAIQEARLELLRQQRQNKAVSETWTYNRFCINSVYKIIILIDFEYILIFMSLHILIKNPINNCLIEFNRS